MLLYGETPEEKYEGYAMGRLGSTRGIFIEMGRVNHACVPTPADHTWLESVRLPAPACAPMCSGGARLAGRGPRAGVH